MRQHRRTHRSADSTRRHDPAHDTGRGPVPRARRAALRGSALAAAAAVLLAACASGSGGSHATGAASTPDPVATGTASGAASPSPTAPSPSASKPVATPSPRSAAPSGSAARALPACSNASQLATWSNRRLALTTIAVPVMETSVSDVRTEVGEGVGGLVLFGNSAPGDLGAQLAALRAHAPGGSKGGLLVMTDEEGGGIQRMANLVGSLPWPAYMGANWSAAQIRSETAKVAAGMAAAGVNMNLAPVADVDGSNVQPSATNPDGLRSFSGDPAVVERDTIAYMQGMRDGGVIPVLKHFPGLGGSNANSDFGPAHTVPWSTEQSVGLPPFEGAIAAGAPAVMVANNTVPGLTSAPAGLSANVIQGVLRGQLGFRGLVVTDALDAKAISAAGYSVPQATVQALAAGADMVMFGLGPDVNGQTSATASAVVSAVDSGRLSRARLISAAGAVLAVQHVDLCRS